eukprot:gene12458-biopygen11000
MRSGPGVTGQWRGRGAGYRQFLGLGGAGVARACPVTPGLIVRPGGVTSPTGFFRGVLSLVPTEQGHIWIPSFLVLIIWQPRAQCAGSKCPRRV